MQEEVIRKKDSLQESQKASARSEQQEDEEEEVYIGREDIIIRPGEESKDWVASDPFSWEKVRFVNICNS